MDKIGKNLKKIRLLKNLSLKEAGQLLGMSATAINKYEKGYLIPNSSKVIEFANAYNVNCIDILRVYEEPELKFTSFKKNEKLTEKKLEVLKMVIQEEVAKYLEVIELNSITAQNISLRKYKCSTLEDAEHASNKFREHIKLSSKYPISDLISILENLGILIIELEDKNNYYEGFEGFSEVVNNIPIIVMKENRTDVCKYRYTLAHELAHLLLRIENPQVNEEKLCDRFASSLLMPKEAVINEFGNNRRNISIYELVVFKIEYKVNYKDIITRLKELNIITEYLYKKLSASHIIDEGITFQPEVSHQFKKLVHKLETDDIITINKACELLGTTPNEYNRENNNYRY